MENIVVAAKKYNIEGTYFDFKIPVKFDPKSAEQIEEQVPQNTLDTHPGIRNLLKTLTEVGPYTFSFRVGGGHEGRPVILVYDVPAPSDLYENLSTLLDTNQCNHVKNKTLFTVTIPLDCIHDPEAANESATSDDQPQLITLDTVSATPEQAPILDIQDSHIPYFMLGGRINISEIEPAGPNGVKQVTPDHRKGCIVVFDAMEDSKYTSAWIELRRTGNQKANDWPLQSFFVKAYLPKGADGKISMNAIENFFNPLVTKLEAINPLLPFVLINECGMAIDNNFYFSISEGKMELLGGEHELPTEVTPPQTPRFPIQWSKPPGHSAESNWDSQFASCVPRDQKNGIDLVHRFLMMIPEFKEGLYNVVYSNTLNGPEPDCFTLEMPMQWNTKLASFYSCKLLFVPMLFAYIRANGLEFSNDLVKGIYTDGKKLIISFSAEHLASLSQTYGQGLGLKPVLSSSDSLESAATTTTTTATETTTTTSVTHAPVIRFGDPVAIENVDTLDKLHPFHHAALLRLNTYLGNALGPNIGAQVIPRYNAGGIITGVRVAITLEPDNNQSARHTLGTLIFNFVLPLQAIGKQVLLQAKEHNPDRYWSIDPDNLVRADPQTDNENVAYLDIELKELSVFGWMCQDPDHASEVPDWTPQ